MHKILKVAQREYIEFVRTKAFIISMLIAPLIIGGIIFFTRMVFRGDSGPRPPVKAAVTDRSDSMTAEIKAAFDKYNDSHPNRRIVLSAIGGHEAQDVPDSVEKQGKAKLRAKQVDAYIVLDSNILEKDGRIHFYTYKPKPAIVDALFTIENLIKQVVIDKRCELRNISSKLLEEVRNVGVDQVEIGTTEDKERVQSRGVITGKMMVPFFFMYLIFLGMMVMGQHMLSSIIEEKNSRVIEVLLSAVSPFELMAGKILGLGGIGLTVTALWAVSAYGAARWQGLEIDVTIELMVYFVIYYILGFLLFSSLLAGIGSICNTLKETQSLMMPITLIFILPLIGWIKLVQSPDGMLSRVLSFVPLLTPMVMVLRLSASPDIWKVEIFASIALLVAAMLAVMWVAAKVFRTGILMYGKRPGLREVLHWLKSA